MSVPVTLQLTNVGYQSTWKLYSASFKGNNLQLHIKAASGTIKMDELRLYPMKSSISTCTYEPLLGKSSVCDANNNIVYFEYDPQGRVQTTRDMEGNIITYSKQVNNGPDN